MNKFDLLAFPRASRAEGSLDVDSQDGMTLRDYFAAQALAGICASPHLDRAKPAGELARNCYGIADAMLAERDR